MPRLTGILETSLYVNNLARSTDFYQTIFQFEMLVQEPRLCALKASDQQVLLLFPRGASAAPISSSAGIIPPHDGSGQLHLAFAVPASELENWELWLAQKRIEIESRVSWPRGGRSIYFRDPDQHLIELVTPGCWANY